MARVDMEAPDAHSSSHLEQNEISFYDIMQVIVDHLRLLIIAPISVGLIALGVSYLLTPSFTAVTRFLPPQQQQSAAAGMLLSMGPLGGLASAAAGIKNPADQYMAFLRTRAVQDSLVNRFNLVDRYEQKFVEDAGLILDKKTVITNKDNVITLEFDDKDPKFAADVANGYTDELSKLIDRLAVSEAQQRRVFFERQLEATKDNLIVAEQMLASSGVSAAALNSMPATALEGPARLRAQITALEVKLAAMRSYLTEGAPEFRQGRAELAALKGQLARAEREQPSSGPGSNDYIAKYREYKYQETLFELFSRLYETAKVDESKQGIVQVLDSAQPPAHKSRPKKALIAVLAALATGGILVAFVFIRAIWLRNLADPAASGKASRLRNSFLHALGRRRV